MSSSRQRRRVWDSEGFRYYCVLYVTCLAAIAGLFFVFVLMGRTPIWEHDAICQYINNLFYARQLLRDVVSEFLKTGTVTIPMYIFNSGYGSDFRIVLGTLLDPYNLLSVFVPKRFIELFYICGDVIRMLLAATTFSIYSFNKGRGRNATLVGSLCYILCGFVIYWAALRHFQFLKWAVLLPLVLFGADRMMDGKKATVFVASLALLLIETVYFSYMTCIFLFFYCLVKYCFGAFERSAASFFKLVGRFVLAAMLSFMIAAIVFAPTVVIMLSMDRVSGHSAVVPLFYSAWYYLSMPAELLGAQYSIDWFWGVAPCLLVIVFLVAGRRFDRSERLPWLVGLVAMTLCALSPKLASMFNGFNYPTSRWTLLFSFVVANIACLVVPVLGKLDKREWARAIAALAVLIAAAGVQKGLVVYAGGDALSLVQLLVVVVLAVLLLVSLFLVVTRVRLRHMRAIASVLTCFLLIGASSSVVFFAAPTPWGAAHGKQFMRQGGAYSAIFKNSPAVAMEGVEEGEPVRYSLPRAYSSHYNTALNHDSMGADFYASLYSQYVDNFRRSLGIDDESSNFIFAGSGSRFAVDSLTAAKYFVAEDDDELRVPYGYEETGYRSGSYGVWKNEHALPLGFATDRVISSEEYEELNMVQRQEALLQGAVMDASEAAAGLDIVSPILTSENLPYTVESTSGAVVEGNSVSVERENAEVHIHLSESPVAELYVCVEGLEFDAYSPAELKRIGNSDKESFLDIVRDMKWSAPERYKVKVACGDFAKAVTVRTSESNQSGNKKDWAVYAGYHDSDSSEIVLTFPTRGVYSFSSFAVIAQPAEPLVEDADALAAGGLSDIVLGTNKVTASIELADDSHAEEAVFTIPYSIGWRAYVDGDEVDVDRVDVAFMGVAVSGRGPHSIELRYETPGLFLGATISLAGIALGVVIMAGRRLVERRKTT